MATEKKRNAKGEGSFKINSNGTITHRKHVGYKLNGGRKILTVTANTKSVVYVKSGKWNRSGRKNRRKSLFQSLLP